MGINVEAQKDGFMEATKGMGNYVFTTDTYVRGWEYDGTDQTVYGHLMLKRFNETPTYTADTYSAIVYSLAPTIEAVGESRRCPTRSLPIWKKPEIFNPGGQNQVLQR